MTRVLLLALLILSALTIVDRLADRGTAATGGAPERLADPPSTPADRAAAGLLAASPPPAAPAAVDAGTHAATPASTPTIDRLARLETRRRFGHSARYTYLDSLFTTVDSTVRRWPDRAGTPLRVRVAVEDSLRAIEPRIARAIANALDRWAALRIGIRFQPANDTTDADIIARAIDRFDTDRSGQADITFTAEGQITSARVTLAVHALDGRPLTDAELAIVATHEIGHALGLPHSSRATDVMYPTARTAEPSDRDRATLTLLYSLIPGSLRVAEP